MIFTPDKIQVRYGTIVRDPIDNFVWEDNTQTIWVSPSEAGDYRVEYIDKYSDEHQEQVAKEAEEVAKKKEEASNPPAFETLQRILPSETLQDLNELQSSLSTMSDDIISSLEFINQIPKAREILQTHYDQVAPIPVTPDLDVYKQQYLTAIQKLIDTCDYSLKGIEETNQEYMILAQRSYYEAMAILQDLGDIILSFLPAQ
jgi:hypothetical protein